MPAALRSPPGAFARLHGVWRPTHDSRSGHVQPRPQQAIGADRNRRRGPLRHENREHLVDDRQLMTPFLITLPHFHLSSSKDQMRRIDATCQNISLMCVSLLASDHQHTGNAVLASRFYFVWCLAPSPHRCWQVHPVKEGEEVFSSFGHLSNAQLLNSYGFVLPG